MSWDAPYPEWPLPQRKDPLYQLFAQDADTFGGDAVQQNNALANFIAPTYDIGRAPNDGIIIEDIEEPFNLAELFKSGAEPAPTVPEIDPRSPGNKFIEEAKQPATDVVAPFLQPETLSQLPADLKAPEAKEEEPAQNESAKYDYNEKNWPSIIPGSTDEDGRFLTKTTTTDGTPYLLHDANEGVWYQNPATVETFERVTSPDGQTYYKVHAPVFSSGKEVYETPVTSVVSEAQYKAIKGPGSFQSILNSPIGSFALNLLGPYGQIINAANAANQGNVAGAVLSGLNAAGGFGMADIGGIPIKDITNTINFAKAVESGDPLSILMSGANLGGVTDVGGVKLQDVSRGIGAIKAIESGNPVAIMNALVGYAPKESAPTEKPIEPEIPLTPEEEAERIENRLNKAITQSQTSPEEQDENTQRVIEELERQAEAQRQADEARFAREEADRLERAAEEARQAALVAEEQRQAEQAQEAARILEESNRAQAPTEAPTEAPIEASTEAPTNLQTVEQQPPAIDDFIKSLEQYKQPTIDELLASIQPKTIDEPPEQQPEELSNNDILKLIGVGEEEPPVLNPTIPDYIAPIDDNELVMTNTKGLPVEPPASSPIDDYFRTITKDPDDELVVTGSRPYALNSTIPDYIAPVDDDELVVTGSKPSDFDRDFDIDTIDPKLPTVVPGISTPKAGAVKTPTKAPTAPKTNAAKTQTTQEAQNNSRLLALLALMDSNNDVAHIKSYKELFDTDLYKPGKTQEEVQKEAQEKVRLEAQNNENTSDNEEDFFNGGHVNDITVDDLLQILRG